jgi:hypothetical protein
MRGKTVRNEAGAIVVSGTSKTDRGALYKKWQKHSKRHIEAVGAEERPRCGHGWCDVAAAAAGGGGWPGVLAPGYTHAPCGPIFPTACPLPLADAW